MPETRFSEFPALSVDPSVGTGNRCLNIFLTNDIKNYYLSFVIDLFHSVSAHAYIGHVARYFPIIGETLQRWSKRILKARIRTSGGSVLSPV